MADQFFSITPLRTIIIIVCSVSVRHLPCEEMTKCVEIVHQFRCGALARVFMSVGECASVHVCVRPRVCVRVLHVHARVFACARAREVQNTTSNTETSGHKPIRTPTCQCIRRVDSG